MSLKPLGDYVIVRPDKIPLQTESGLYIHTEASVPTSQEGTIVEVGQGRYEDGKVIPMSLQIGDKVLFAKYSGTEYKDLLILHESDILAVVV